MNENPLVSIIITTCKREIDILERAIKSAKRQDYVNREIIVVNDHPPYEKKINILLHRYPEVLFISNEKQSGACVSRNRGIDAANGEFIALLDDDDEWLPEKLSMQIKVADSDTVLVYCDIAAIKDGVELKSDPDRPYPEGKVLREILESNFVGGCSVPVMKKSSVIKCGGFDPSFRSCQDLDLWIRLAKEGDFKAVQSKLVKYTVGDASITGSLDRRVEGWERILSKYENDYLEHPLARTAFTSTMVREAAKRGTLGYAAGIWKKYGNTPELLKGIIMKMIGIY